MTRKRTSACFALLTTKYYETDQNRRYLINVKVTIVNRKRNRFGNIIGYNLYI